MINPATTYRIQFNKSFTFSDLKKILPYLQQLGITTIYASPIFEAVPGSVHGYDITNPLRINPEIGTEEELLDISTWLKKHQMYWLQDIVPNHMAFHSNNAWLMDVLEKGPRSSYATYFDTTWSSNFFSGPLMVPFLGHELDEEIRAGNLKITLREGRLVISYFENHFPVPPGSYAGILDLLPAPSSHLAQLQKEMQEAELIEDDITWRERWHEIQLQLLALQNTSEAPALEAAIEAHVAGNSSWLQGICSNDNYRLCHWQETERQINYRRFFTINSLICLNIQDESVFRHHHSYIKNLCDNGVFDGLRIDHIDGLLAPTFYLQQLRSWVGDHIYIVVEKILALGESLPASWPVQGTSGYEFLAAVNNLLTDPAGEKAITAAYQSFTGNSTDPHQAVYEKKRMILSQYMQGELENLTDYFVRELNPEVDFPRHQVRALLENFLVRCPVYRFYGEQPAEDKELIASLLKEITEADPALKKPAHHFEKMLFADKPAGAASAFYQRLMQFTGPLMAKGVEDTLMYTYNRFAAHNEVGDHPDYFGLDIATFHRHMQQRQRLWPLSLNASATHDTKRGEDARSRLLLLSQVGNEWSTVLNQWASLNREAAREQNIRPEDECLLYQALVAHAQADDVKSDAFRNRLHAYLVKALREGKEVSDWSSPNQDYESAIKRFADHILGSKPFIRAFEKFAGQIAMHASLQSWVQTILKFTCPGIPDIYQGSEGWDHSFVDPDNRRPVNYPHRQEQLAKASAPAFYQWLEKDKGEAGKISIVQSLGNARRNWPWLWSEGGYQPLAVSGRLKDHVIAFARRHTDDVTIVVLPLYLLRLCQEQGCHLADIDWGDTEVKLPGDIHHMLSDVFSGTVHKSTHRSLKLSILFKQQPFAVLHTHTARSNNRGAGILLSLSSLPGPFGVGDLGPEADRFLQFLRAAGQKYWQLLPVNPVEEGQGFSPYSATSGMAGNTLYISPQFLHQLDLLEESELPAIHPQTDRANFREAGIVKEFLLKKAWERFEKGHHLKKAFDGFRRKEAHWLEDFASYTLLKQMHGGAWFEWPEAFRLHQRSALRKLQRRHEAQLREIEWQQFIFHLQWESFKKRCRQHHITIIGDLPFYVSYDSADVWANRELFALDKDGNRTGMAGVPPDAFSDDGQLWGMPVYNWRTMKKQGYKWWIQRLAKNLELFDLVRIDHFRALESYWEVPAGAATAREGTWQQGPGAEFFQIMQKQFGRLPFLAEDLGDVDDAVFALRDQFSLPGMKVLQFAFGEDVADSPHAPHNYPVNAVVYTGTHDNNTTRGWYRKDADSLVKTNLEAYTGMPVTEMTVPEILARTALASVANMAILPMQDVLGLDENARMNIPASAHDNWRWRLTPDLLQASFAARLRRWTGLYRRAPF